MKKKHYFRVLQVLLLAVLVVSFYGCGAGNKGYTSETVQMSKDSAAEAKTEDAAAMPQETAASQEAAPQEETAKSDQPNVNTAMNYNRKIIRTGELHLQTKDFKKCTEDVISSIQTLGGYVESSDIQGSSLYNEPGDSRSASIVVRIPQKQFDAFMNNAGKFGNVISTKSSSQDITGEYVDTQIRLKALKARHERLLELLKQSGSLKDLFEIEKELGDVTYEIEKLSGQLQNYDQLVDMSTISIQIEEVYQIKEVRPVSTFGDKIASTFIQSVSALKTFLQAVVLVIVGLMPFLVIAVPVGIAIIVIKKRNGRKHKINPKESEDNK